jgi:chemotaxis signal transduction protein
MTTDAQDSLSPDAPHPDVQAMTPMLELAILHCGGASFGMDVKWVREIRPFAGAAPVYGVPAFWIGVTALRGELFAVLDLRRFLFPHHRSTVDQKHVVFTSVNNLRIGLAVEEMPTIRQIDVQSMTAISSTEVPHAVGVLPDQITVLDLPRLFTDPRMTVLAGTAKDTGL